MNSKIRGYKRVSSTDQNDSRQLYGIKIDVEYVDKVSGKNSDRIALNKMINECKPGDKIIVHSMDRLARNLMDLLSLVKAFTANDVSVEFVKEKQIFNGESDAFSKFFLSMMGAVAEFEVNIINERQREGIFLAKKRGVYKGTEKTLDIHQIKELIESCIDGVPKLKVAQNFGVCRQTVYNYLGYVHKKLVPAIN